MLYVNSLNISYRVKRRWIRAVRDFRIEIKAGQIYGIVGESGSGKSTVASGILRSLAANGRAEPGSVIEFLGQDLATVPRSAMQRLWGAKMSLVPQNPGAALNPSIRVGEQVIEILRYHAGLSTASAREHVIHMFQRVNLADPEGILRRYPHELSGGMQQRVVIAMALITQPRLLILDEPTTNLDVTTEAVILDLVRELIRDEQAGAIYVTHNLGVVAQLCERVIVMYAGEIVEDGPVIALFARPRHPYTIGLLNSVPRLGQQKHEAPLHTIPGQAPSLAALPAGCGYAPRCPLAVAICHTRPPLETTGDDHAVRCHRWQEIATGALTVIAPAPVSVYSQPEAVDLSAAGPEHERLLHARKLTKHFAIPRSPGDVLRGSPLAPVRAVDGINLHIPKGRTLGLVGESGSGKTTLARVLIGLTDRTDGTIEMMGTPVTGTVRQRSRALLAQLQMVFQNPQDSLNPYLTVGQALRRPLIRLARLSREQADREAARLLGAVNLPVDYAGRYPGELSGGEKQRVAIARAFASDPALIICDEPVSALDVSVQAAVLNVLARLQQEHHTAYLFISHDLAVVGYLSDIIAVMYLGQLFEVGAAHDLFAPPYHPYTEALVSAAPRPEPSQASQRIRLTDDIPSPRAMPNGCRFHTRCPHKIGPLCEQQEPPWRDDGNGHFIRCHIPLDDLRARQSASPDQEP